MFECFVVEGLVVEGSVVQFKGFVLEGSGMEGGVEKGCVVEGSVARDTTLPCDMPPAAVGGGFKASVTVWGCVVTADITAESKAVSFSDHDRLHQSSALNRFDRTRPNMIQVNYRFNIIYGYYVIFFLLSLFQASF